MINIIIYWFFELKLKTQSIRRKSLVVYYMHLLGVYPFRQLIYYIIKHVTAICSKFYTK